MGGRGASYGVSAIAAISPVGISREKVQRIHVISGMTLEKRAYVNEKTTLAFLEAKKLSYLMALAWEQIRLAFEQSEKEVTDLHQRTREGIETARLAGKQIGHERGITFETRKARAAKALICKHARAFGGNLSDADVIRHISISRNSYYKYCREIRAEIRPESAALP